jgi:MFS transporter, OFA family, oxalate/formate antiporter
MARKPGNATPRLAATLALLALFVLKPMRQAHKQKHASAIGDMSFASVAKE